MVDGTLGGGTALSHADLGLTSGGTLDTTAGVDLVAVSHAQLGAFGIHSLDGSTANLSLGGASSLGNRPSLNGGGTSLGRASSLGGSSSLDGRASSSGCSTGHSFLL